MFTLLPPQKELNVTACVVLYNPDRGEYHLLSEVGNNWRLSTALVKGECVGDVFRVETESGSTYDLDKDAVKMTDYLKGMLKLITGHANADLTLFATDAKVMIQVIDALK